MPAAIWFIIAIILLAALCGGKKKNAPQGPHRIDRPHVIYPDDYECSACHRRFRKNTMACPYCGTRFTASVTDEEEFICEEDELESWDEEDGV